MFRYIKKVFIAAMPFFSCNAPKFISMNNQECKVRLEVINIHNNEPSFYPYSVKISKRSGSCNNINDPYAKLCVPHVSKNMSVKVFNLISRTNEARWHETCKCKGRLDVRVCNNKQRWNKDKCRCECKELIDKGIYDKGFNWNPSNWECECDKSCGVGGNLDYKNCKCRKRLVDKLIEECNKNIDEKQLHPTELHSSKMIYNSAINYYEKICSPCTICIVFLLYF